jgi:uncharacterized protein (TIGR01777 family)
MTTDATLRGVLVTGGTGFIGRHVVRALRARQVDVWVWSRRVARARARLGADVRVVGTLAEIPGDARIDAIVNLAGAPVIGPPWTRARRQLLIDSRVNTTQAVLEWCAARAPRPAALVTASAIGYYGGYCGPAGDAWLDESSPSQDDFQSRLCREREASANGAESLGMRAVNLRIGLVLGTDGGIFARLALAARLGGAAVIGDGLQWMSWIHIRDLVRIVELALDEVTLRGAVNAVAPAPVRQLYFQRALACALNRPCWLRVPAAALRRCLGEMAELLVCGQRVAPRRLLAQGFQFQHATFESALADLVRRGRS